jgi:hypothetical protein
MTLLAWILNKKRSGIDWEANGSVWRETIFIWLVGPTLVITRCSTSKSMPKYHLWSNFGGIDLASV